VAATTLNKKSHPMSDQKARGETRGLPLCAALLLLGAGPVIALELDDIRVTKQGRAYLTQVTFDIPPPSDRVKAVLTDYEHPHRLTPDFTKREVIRRHSGIRVRTQVHACVLFFCKDLTLTQDVTLSADAIVADTVPEHSDFRSGYVSWVVTSNKSGGAHIRYESVMEPNFSVPPVIGRFFVRNRLRQQVLATARNLERESAVEMVPTR